MGVNAGVNQNVCNKMLKHFMGERQSEPLNSIKCKNHFMGVVVIGVNVGVNHGAHTTMSAMRQLRH